LTAALLLCLLVCPLRALNRPGLTWGWMLWIRVAAGEVGQLLIVR
jgi:hypothetical protein